MTINEAAARTFLRTHARIIEVRLAEFMLDGLDEAARGAIAGIEAYRNSDGGFGNGLESDVLAPSSQPLGVDTAFGLLADIALSAKNQAIVDQAAHTATGSLDYVDSVSNAEGGLAIVFPSIVDYPRADHWGDGRFPPALNPTAKIVANARVLGLEHPWMDRAVHFCRSAIDDPDSASDAHAALCVLRFLETDTDRDRSRQAYEQILGRIDEIALFKPMPGPGYGLTPLDFAPTPESPRRRFFTDKAIEAHLDELASAQLDDGGWSVTWTPPGPAPLLAWRGVVTLNALRVLRAYGRI